MATTSEYLTHLQEDKKNLANILVAKGVNANDSETFTSLVSKVIEIEDTGEANPILQNKTVNPTEKGTSVTYDENYDGLEVVTVNPIKANMIEGLKPEIIKKGIEILDIVGTYGSTSQIKYATPSQEEQIIKPDEGIEFLSQVTIQPVTSGIDADITPTNIRKGINILGVEGTFGGELNFQKKSVSANAEEDLIVTPDYGYDAIDSITVKKVTSNIDSDIKPENIRRDVNILGVTGTYAPEPSMTDKYISPKTYEQEIYPDEGYGYFDKVTVGKVTSSIDSNITSSNIRKNVKILGVEGTIEEVKGETKYINPSTKEQTIFPDTSNGKNAITKAIVNPVTSAIDNNIVNTNIKKGVSILGVEGSFEGASILQNKTVSPSNKEQQIIADAGYDALSKVTIEPVTTEDITVNPDMSSKTYTRSDGKFINSVTVNQVTSDVDANIVPENIKQNMSILGVVGTYKGEQQNYFSALNQGGGTNSTGLLSSIIDIPEDLVITQGQFMFQNCRAFVKVPRLDYSTLTLCNGMFKGCSSITDTTNAVNFKSITYSSEMFQECSKITNIDMSSWKVTNLTNAKNMFYYCTKLTNVTIGAWTGSKILSLEGMFSNCSQLKSVDFSKANLHFATSGTRTMYQMFGHCTGITSIDLSGVYVDVSGVNITYAFYGCTALQHLDIRNIDLTIVNAGSYFIDKVPTLCEVIVGTDESKAKLTALFPNHTNIKTVAEYEAEQGE